VNETAADVEWLQALLDRSYASAGQHLREVITPERRLSAGKLCARLTGMRLLVLATTAADGRPLTGPVDGVFYKGAFNFGSSPDSTRIRHIRQRPAVSATHLPGEEFSVTVHGRATILDMGARENADLRNVLLELYTPVYGADWESFLDANTRARIDADRMFTYCMQ
jgi:nitroimidazol reductase NimA-like FMN-containing flavoprotein (pyridoxamine 5'-phosphate oxidase superfamily)